MASKVGPMSPTKSATRGWIPDQHGAWVMVTVPLLVGVWLAGPRWIHVPLGLAWYLGYFAFFAASGWLRASVKRKPSYVPALAVYAVGCALAAGGVVKQVPTVLGWVAVFGPLIVAAVWEAYRRRPRSLLSGLSTVIASAAMIPLASFVAGQSVSRDVVLVAVVVGLYFCGTVFYVKSLIRERRNPRFVWYSVAFHLVAALVCAGLGMWASGLVLLLLSVRAWLLPWWGARRGKPWTPKFIGISELVSCAIVVIAAVIFDISV